MTGEPHRPALTSDRHGLTEDERGASAVEFALILPMLVLLLVGIAQFGAAFFTQSEMLNVAREASRRLATGALKAGDTSAWVGTQMPGRAITVAVTSPSGGNDIYTVSLSLPLAELTGIDPFGLLGSKSLNAAVSIRNEGGS